MLRTIFLRFTSLIAASLAISACQSPSTAVKPLPQGAAYLYTVDATDVESHHFRITLVPQGVALPQEVFFYIPAWAPGAYQFTQHGRYVKDLKAISKSGGELSVEKIGLDSWKISGGTDLARIEYRVNEMKRPELLWPETTELNSKRGFFNGTNVFGYFDTVKSVLCKVDYKLPDGWRVASAIETAPNSANAVASDYDELVDAPVIMGKFERIDFMCAGKPHTIALDADSLGKEAFKADSLVAVTKEIIVAHERLFGELPYKNYLFIHRLVKPNLFGAFGALEHRNSSAYYMPYLAWREVRDNQLTNVISHEFFHLWNPKRIHTALLGPFDYQNKIKTKTVWFAEGMTDYYADLLLLKGRIITEPNFFSSILGRIRQLSMFSALASMKESLESLSLRLASVEETNEIIPFYFKGTLAMMMLDIELRTQTENRYGTDDLMKAMNALYAKTGKTFADDELPALISKLSGANITEFHQKYLATNSPVPYEAYFEKMGLKVQKKTEMAAYMGWFVLPDSAGNYVVYGTAEGSTAEKMGLKEKDVVLKINETGFEQQEAFLKYLLGTATHKVGDAVTVSVRRGKKELVMTGKVGSRESKTETLIPNAAATALQKAIREKMLNGF